MSWRQGDRADPFPATLRAYHTDRDATHDFATALPEEPYIDRVIEKTKRDSKARRLRIAHYRLERVEEVDLDARVAGAVDGEEGSQG